MLDMARHVMNALHVSQECPAVKTPERRWFVKVWTVIKCACIIQQHGFKPDIHRAALNLYYLVALHAC